MSKKIIIGRFAGAYGIKGCLHLISFTDPPENIFQYSNWQTQKHNVWLPIHFETYKTHGNHFIVKLKDCDDRDQAMQLKNLEIAVDRADLPKIKNHKYYWDDLTGLTVVNLSGKTLGVIDHLLATGANDVIVLQNPQKQMIPYIKSVIQKIDLEKKMVWVDWE